MGNREQRENKYIFFKFWTVIIWSNSQTLFFSLPYTNQGIEYLNIKVTFTFSIFPKRPDRKQICRPFKYIFKNPNNFIQFMYFCFKNFKKRFLFFVDLLAVYLYIFLLCYVLTYKKWVFNLSKFRTKEFFYCQCRCFCEETAKVAKKECSFF